MLLPRSLEFDSPVTPAAHSAEIAGTVAAHGLRIRLEDGTELLDAVSGTFNVPLGYSHPAVVAAVQAQVGRIAHLNSHLAGKDVARLADALLGHAPPGIGAAWIRDITGSTANEAAVKIAQKATGRSDIVSVFLSHHGQTLFTTGLSGSKLRRTGFPNAVVGTSVKVPGPYCHRCFYRASPDSCGLLCVERISDFIEHVSSGSVAAVIIEPVLGNGGNIVPPPGYLPALRKLCDEHDMLLIADEVQTGLGRTGHMFASAAMDLRPDIITLGKGLGGIGIPMAAVLMRPELAVLDAHEHSFTSGGNMLGVVAALATIDVIGSPGFLETVRERGRFLGAALRKLGRKYPFVSDVRGLGYMWGLEIAASNGRSNAALTGSIIERALEHERLVLRGSQYGRGNVVKVRPALISTREDLDEIVTRLDRALAAHLD